MARKVSLGRFQDMARAGTLAADDLDGLTVDAVDAEDVTAYADAPDEIIASLGQDDPAGDGPIEPKAEDRATVAEQLRALGVELVATAEWSRSLIVGSITQRSFNVDPPPTEDDIQAEADRIWSSFGDNRGGPRVATVDGTTGEVRDWRRPDTTPDRGPDVGTTHHTVTDETAEQQASMFLIPTDQQFEGRLYRAAPELANIADRLIEQHGFLSELINCDIRWYWKRKTGVAKGRVKIGFMKRASDLLGHFSGADFIGWLSATTARDGKFTDRQVEAAVFHQLLHVGADEKGNWIFAPHDFEGFAAEVRHYGTWTEDLKLGGTAFVAAHQMGLFDATDEDEDDDEGEDVADEVIRQVDEEEGDEPADPDGPAPDEVDDLADLPVL